MNFEGMTPQQAAECITSSYAIDAQRDEYVADACEHFYRLGCSETEHAIVLLAAKRNSRIVEQCKVAAAAVRDTYAPGSPQAHAAQAVLDAIRKRFPEGK